MFLCKGNNTEFIINNHGKKKNIRQSNSLFNLTLGSIMLSPIDVFSEN